MPRQRSLGLPLICALLFLDALVAGCQATAPDVGDAVGAPMRVTAPALEEEVGKLMLGSDGQWSYLFSHPGRGSNLAPGTVAAFGEPEGKARHLFAVAEVHRWGARLVRLDSGPVDTRHSGSLFPLASLDRQTSRRWGLCTGGGGELRDSACLRQAPIGTRWQVYPLATIAAGERAASVYVGGEANLVEGDAQTPWVAVPGPLTPPPTQPRIAVGAECAKRVGPMGVDAHAEWFEAEVVPVAHPVAVEAEAYRLAADALVWCDDAIHVAAPGVHRPSVKTLGRDLGPPLTALKAWTLDEMEPERARRAVRALAAAATGDFVTADFLLAPAMPFATEAMGIAVAAGRPDAALAMGRGATARSWNRENDTAWLHGMASVEAALGLRRQVAERRTALGKATGRQGDEAMAAWLVWSELRPKLSADPDRAASLLELAASRLEDEDEERTSYAAWRALLGALAARSREDAKTLEAMGEVLGRHGAAPLADAYLGRDVALPCPPSAKGEGCVVDVYGRRFADGARAHQALDRVGVIELRPGFTLDDQQIPPRQLLSLMPLLERQQRPAALRLVAQELRAFLARPDACDDRAFRSRLREGASTLLPRLQESSADAAAWAVLVGLPAACRGLDTLARTSARFVDDHPDKGWLPTALLEGLLAADRVALRDAAAFASEWERGPLCLRWNLALAAAYADAGRLEAATRFLEQIPHCRVKPVPDERALIFSFIRYQENGEIREIATQLPDPSTRQLEALAGIVPDDDPVLRCAGLQELQPSLVAAMPEAIRLLAMSVEIAPEEPDDGLFTAADRLRDAEAVLDAVGRQLSAGDVDEARASLERVRDALEQIDHRVGLARVAFLQAIVFDGTSRWSARLRAGEAAELAAEASEAPAAVKIAAALLLGEEERALRVLAAMPERTGLETLCSVPSEH